MKVLVPTETAKEAADGFAELDPVLYRFGERAPKQAVGSRAIIVQGFYPWCELEPLIREIGTIELIQTLSQGVDGLRGIPEQYLVSNAQGAHGGATAEWAAAVLLALARGLPQFISQASEHVWKPFSTAGLDGARVLVLGAGDLAREFAKRIEPFGANLTFVGRSARQGVYGVHELPELLPYADAVVVMVSYNSGTVSLVDSAFLGAMKRGAVLVNAARGGVLDQDALLDELRGGRISAAVDVADPEPLPPESPLWDAPNLLITPHVGGLTAGVIERETLVALQQVAMFARGEAPSNLRKREDLI